MSKLFASTSKIGSPIRLLTNLNSPKHNGVRMIVQQMSNNIMEAKLMNGKAKGHTVFAPRMPLISTELPFQFRRLQFPIKLPYSFIIYKAQGQALKHCGFNLKDSCFSHGQLYLHRLSRRNFKILNLYTRDIKKKKMLFIANRIFFQ